MSRNELRNRRPAFTCGYGQGYTPAPQAETLGSVLVGVFMWGVIIAAGVATALPVVSWVVRLALA